MDLSRVSVGIPGALDATLVRELAPLVERAGFRSLWINDTPDGDSLAGLAAAQDVTSTLLLATGVIPLDRRPASEVLAGAARLDPARLTLGVGSGGWRSPLGLVSRAVDELRAGTTASIVVGALGPRMRELAATRSDGVLLNWLTPKGAREAMADLRRVGRARGILYVRTVVDDSALLALAEEAARYQGYPNYAANFERLGVTAMDTTIEGADPHRLREQVHAYTSVLDEVVLRAVVAEPTFDRFAQFISRAAAA